MKTLGSSIARMLTAGLLAVALVSTAGAASPRPASIYALLQGQTRPGETPDLSLLRLDPTTLAETGRTSFGRGYIRPGSRPYALAQGRARLAVAVGASLRIVDIERLQLLREVRLQGQVLGLTWSASGDLLALRDGAFVRIDPEEGRVLGEWDISNVAAVQGGHGRAVALTGLRYLEHRGVMGGEPIRVTAIEQEGGPRSVRINRVRFGLEQWHVRRGAVLPPKAKAGISQARSDLAARQQVSRDQIEILSVIPFLQTCAVCIPYRGHYEIVLSAAGRYFLYGASLDEFGGSITARFDSELPSRPASSASDILRAPPGTWEVTNAGIAVARNRVYVATSGPLVVDVDLKSNRVRYRQLRRALGGAANPLRMGRALLAVATTAAVKVVDLGTGKVRSLRRSGGAEIDPAGDGIAVSSNLHLTAYDGRGRARYAVGLGALVDRVQVAGGLAYARLIDPITSARYVAVLDLEDEGRELHRERVPITLELLVGR